MAETAVQGCCPFLVSAVSYLFYHCCLSAHVCGFYIPFSITFRYIVDNIERILMAQTCVAHLRWAWVEFYSLQILFNQSEHNKQLTGKLRDSHADKTDVTLYVKDSFAFVNFMGKS